MMHAVSPALRRVLAFTLLLALLSLAWGGIVEPLIAGYREDIGNAARMRAAAARSGAAAERIAALRAELDKAEEARAGQGGFLDAGNASMASVEMQDIVRRAAQDTGADLRTIQMLDSREEELFSRITVEADLAIDIEGLRDLLYNLESSMPYLVLDSVLVRSRPQHRGTAAPDGMLDVTIAVSGFLRPALQTQS